MSEPDFNIETVDAGDIGYNHLNLQAELTELDDIYDGALLFFEWGESDSLEEGETELATVIMKDEDGNFEGSVTGEQFTADEGKWVDLDYYNIKMPVEVTDTDDDELYNEGPEDDYEFDYVNGRIKVLEDGDMEDGTDYEVDYDYGYGNVIIDELSENTEYHYKAIAESIAYDSEASMENIFENERNTEAIFNAINAMDVFTDSEDDMDAITDSEMLMDKAMADVIPRTKMFLSPYITADENCKMWSKEMASERFWEIDSKSWGEGSQSLWKTTIDFTGFNTLKFERYKNDHDLNDQIVEVDGDRIWANGDVSGEWYEVSLDVSEYEGELSLKLGTTEDPRDDYYWILVKQDGVYALVIGDGTTHKTDSLPENVYGAFHKLILEE